MHADHSKRRALAVVAEDEPLMRMLTADLLTEAGFDVIEVGNASNALAHLEENDCITLLVTDIRMPGSLDGLALAHEVDTRWPSIGIIICSVLKDIDQNALPAKAVFFDKPYRPSLVLAAVEKATGGQPDLAEA